MALMACLDAVRVVKKRNPDIMSCGAKGRSTSAISAPNISIVNGQPASQCEWKWQVQLRQGDWHFCGGMLITPEWVLTAAHCLNDGSFSVTAGELDLDRKSGTEQNRKMVREILHPRYKPATTENDIGLVKVDTPFNMGDCVGTVCLPDSDVKAGSDCWITGWGTLREDGPGADVLQEGEVQTMSNSDCRNTGYDAYEITDDMLCAQGRRNGKPVDACQGDSGGPLVCQSGGTWFIHGATSWGSGCARANYPGIWSKVYYFRSWIDGVIASGGGDSPPRRRSSSEERRRRRRRRA